MGQLPDMDATIRRGDTKFETCSCMSCH